MHLVEWRLVSNENTVDCCLGTVTRCMSYHYIHLYIFIPAHAVLTPPPENGPVHLYSAACNHWQTMVDY